jgi:hypothetical protein
VSSPDASHPRVRLRIGRVYRDALTVYWARLPRVVGTALLVLVPITALQVVLTDVGRPGPAPSSNVEVLVVVASLALSGLGTFGTTFYAGVLDRTVGAARGDDPERSIAEVFRTLPYRRLIGADLLFWALVVVGSLALVIPGLIALTVFSIVGPVLVVEDRRVVDAFRRSYRLVRPSFWRVVVTVLIPTVLESMLADQLLAIAAHPSVLHELLVECTLTAIVGSFVTLVEVQTAYQLMDLDRAAPAGPAG